MQGCGLLCDYVVDCEPEASGGCWISWLDGGVVVRDLLQTLGRLDRVEVAYRMGSGKPTAIYDSIPLNEKCLDGREEG